MVLKSNDCPRCKPPDTIPYSFGDDKSASFGTRIQAAMCEALYPDARLCVDCEHVWWQDPRTPINLANAKTAEPMALSFYAFVTKSRL